MKFRFLLVLMLLAAQISFAQEGAQARFAQRFENGTLLYGQSRWQEAAVEFRHAQETAANRNEWANALYWVILSELGFGDFGSALRDMDELEKNAPGSEYTKDMVYHRARIYFNQGYFEDAMVLFGRYSNSIPDDDGKQASSDSAYRKASAFFWIGECLYTMGQFDEAEKFYAYVVSKYPGSPKVEISTYRIDLIKQKKIEAELLALLRWSHEESLRTSEDYQRRIKTYEHTLNTYQKRLAEQAQRSAGDSEGIDSQEDDSSNNNLRDRARRLGGEVQQIIKNIEDGGSQ